MVFFKIEYFFLKWDMNCCVDPNLGVAMEFALIVRMVIYVDVDVFRLFTCSR